MFLSKVSRRLGVHRRLYRLLMRSLPGMGKQAGIGFNEAVETLNGVFHDGCGSCVCGRLSERENPVYDLDVIIPVYNTESFVSECIESVLGQKTKFTFHVTIVNDGSTDGSVEVIARYAADSRVTVVNQENKGLGAARNAGLRRAKGRYVCFVDSDDVLPEGSIDALMSKAVEGGYDIVGGGYSRFYDKDDVAVIMPATSDDLFGLMCGKVYRTSLWDGLQIPEGCWFEDTVNSFIIYDRAKSHTSLRRVVYRWRKNKRSITSLSVGRPKVVDTVYVTMRLLEDRRMLGLPMDAGFLDNLLYQFKENALRIYSLGNAEVDYANFVISTGLYMRCYGGGDFHSSAFKKIEEAVLNGDYKQFILACIFL